MAPDCTSSRRSGACCISTAANSRSRSDPAQPDLLVAFASTATLALPCRLGRGVVSIAPSVTDQRKQTSCCLPAQERAAHSKTFGVSNPSVTLRSGRRRRLETAASDWLLSRERLNQTKTEEKPPLPQTRASACEAVYLEQRCPLCRRSGSASFRQMLPSLFNVTNEHV